MRGALLAVVLLGLTACESSRQIAIRPTHRVETVDCVGFDRQGERAGISYRVSTRNIVVGAFFVEMIAPPVIVALSETYCPVADTTVAP